MRKDLSETDRRLNVEGRLLAVLSDYGGQLIQSSPAMGRMIERMADAAEALAREGFLTPPADGFDPTTTPGAHEWFAAALRERESAAHPLSWPDRPDVFWCAGVAGGCDVYHRRDYPHRDVTADGMPVTVCAPTVDKDAPADPNHDETISSWGTRAVLAVLDQAGLPLGEPTEVNAEYSVWWHGGGGDGIRMSQNHIGTLGQAREVGPTRFGAYGITRFTVHRREHRRYANGATLIGPWMEVPDGAGEPPPDVPAGGRGECRS